MKLYVARHGRTNYNDLDLCNADPAVDVHLTPVGIAQAEALADKLRQARIDHIFVSELKRTQKTADIVNKFHGSTVAIDARLNDGRSGFEGKPGTDYHKALDAAADKWNARFNDGESIEDVKIRVATFIDDLRAQKHDSILLISSEWPIQAMLTILQNLTNEAAYGSEVPQGDCIELRM